MGPRLGNGFSPCFFAFLRGGIRQAIPKSFLFFGENFLLLVYSKSDGVLCFHYLRMRIANNTYHVRTYERTYASSTVSRHSGAKTKKDVQDNHYYQTTKDQDEVEQ